MNAPRLVDRFRGHTRAAAPVTSWGALQQLQLLYNGTAYNLFHQGSHGKTERPALSLQSAVRRNGIVFGLVQRRADLVSQARFGLRDVTSPGLPTVADLDITSPALDPIRRPSRLLRRMEWDCSVAGTAYVVRVDGGPIRRLNPEWVTLVFASPLPATVDPEALASSAELVSLLYAPSGRETAEEPLEVFTRGEFGVFAPIPDPTLRGRGMSWIEAVLGEVDTDGLASEYVRNFYVNSATPNFVVSLDKEISQAHAEAFLAQFEEQHQGVSEAFRTIILGAGAKPTVIGSKLADLDSEHVTKLLHASMAVAAGVPAVVAGVLPGLESSTFANYHQANRSFGDLTARSWWEEAALAFTPLLDIPAGRELWPDTSMVAAMQDDLKDDADVQSARAATIRQLVDAGFKPETVVDAVKTGDLGRLEHSDLFSVQLQPPTANEPEPDPDPDPDPEPVAEGPDPE